MKLAPVESFMDSCFRRNDKMRAEMTNLGVNLFYLVCHSRESGNPKEEIYVVLF